MNDFLIDEPIEVLKKKVLYLFNPGLFNLGFAYIISRKKGNHCRLDFFFTNEQKYVNEECMTIQEAKIRFMTLFKDYPFLATHDPVWLPLDLPQLAHWKKNMGIPNKMKPETSDIK